MTREELRDEINARINIRDVAERYLERDGCGKGYVCPVCGSGGHSARGDGLTVWLQENVLRCFVCDGKGGNAGRRFDVLDVIQNGEHCSYSRALEIGASELGIAWGDVANSSPYRPTTPTRTAARTRPPEAPTGDPSKNPAQSYEDYLKRAQAALTDESAGAQYLRSRNLNVERARALGIGFDPAWRHPKVSESVPASPRMIIPVDTGTYETRDIRPDEELAKIKNGLKYKKQSVSPKGVFNIAELEQAAPVCVVEGWADALAVVCAGGHAVALNSTTGLNRFIALLARMDAANIPPLILALDPDGAGAGAQAKLTAFLDARHIPYFIGTICQPDPKEPGKQLDPAASYLANAQQFRLALHNDIKAAMERAKAATDVPGTDEQPGVIPFDDEKAQREFGDKNKRAATVAALRISGYRQTYLEHVASERQHFISTGLETLDSILGGGLYPGMFCLGGVTGAGKSSLALQVADHIAEHGRPVLYIALEMSRDELISKSLARLHFDMTGDNTAWNRILQGKYMPKAAVDRYFDAVAPNLYIVESVASETANSISKTARAVADVLGVAPVVIVDYLQIMGADNERATEKQTADYGAKTCKLLARDLETPVIVITSYARASYGLKPGASDSDWQGLILAAGKESGGIEYTADCVLGMRVTDENRDHNGRIVSKSIRLYMPKNRRGDPKQQGDFTFYGGPSCYICDAEAYTGATPWDSSSATSDRPCY